jgi:nicotinamide mononucleotide adenylyltransferase
LIRTNITLDEINTRLGGVDYGNGQKEKVQIMLAGGADLVETFSQPGVWSPVDLNHILLDYGAIILERSGTDLTACLSKLEPAWVNSIHVISQPIKNDVSSTKIRAALGSNMSIRYLLPEPVIDYIEKNKLYLPKNGSIEPQATQ